MPHVITQQAISFAQSVRCPKCGAQPGTPCVNYATDDVYRNWCHSQRCKLARGTADVRQTDKPAAWKANHGQ